MHISKTWSQTNKYKYWSSGQIVKGALKIAKSQPYSFDVWSTSVGVKWWQIDDQNPRNTLLGHAFYSIHHISSLFIYWTDKKICMRLNDSRAI